jgi:hypothetical protein
MLNYSAGSSASTNVNLTRSLRFRSASTLYLQKAYTAGTSPVDTNSFKKTYSVWVKRGNLGSPGYVFLANVTSPATDGWAIFFTSGDKLQVQQVIAGTATAVLLTNAVYRDPAAWYHIVVAVDTTQAVAADRWKVYVNGTQITSFDGSSTYPTINSYSASFLTPLVGTYNGTIGAYNGTVPFDGFLAELNVIDGQQLLPTSFGSFSGATGVWQPLKYSGTYGVNGFYQPYTDNTSLTTSSNVGIGKDFSGNGNFYPTFNISITPGLGYDSSTDVPTLTNTTTANYCTLNPLTTVAPASTFLFNANSYFYHNNTVQWLSVGSTMAVSSGKWYWEVTATNIFPSTSIMVGLAASIVPSTFITNFYFAGQGANDYGYITNGNKWNNSVGTAYGAAYTTNDVIGVALDMDAGTLTFYKNNVSQGVAFTGLVGSYTPVVSSLDGVAFPNFGQRPFTYTPPSGFVALNTFNLPAATIVKGNTVMDATIYTATGTTQSITNAGGFKPDLVWQKQRTNPDNNILNDSVRGAGKNLVSNATFIESSDPNFLTSFNANGWTQGTSNYSNGLNVVGWQWQAGQGVTSTNTDGTITSTVSVNANAGFSVVTYTGNGSASQTVGHGLGVAPAFIIVKTRGAVTDWPCYHQTLGKDAYVLLNTGGALVTLTNIWGVTPPSSTSFGVYPGATSANNYASSSTVAYCWATVPGYSAFGIYSGNGNAEGPFVYTGFRPKFILLKIVSIAEAWIIYDTARNTFNVLGEYLIPNSTAAAATVTSLDILSNGFKIRNITTAFNNASSGIIYAAFAENPFKYSLAR